MYIDVHDAVASQQELPTFMPMATSTAKKERKLAGTQIKGLKSINSEGPTAKTAA